MTELKRFLNLNLPEIDIIKLKTEILVPQKTLSTTQDRIANSQSTFLVSQIDVKSTKVLIIDDFAGSGATINYIAKKIREKHLLTSPSQTIEITGLALCGTPNGVIDSSKKFEIVKEV
jgi:predicted amidophosphoribosyltransferase